MASDNNPDGVTIRSETPEDKAAIFSLVAHAFDSDLEAKLVDRLRDDGDLVLLLVAEKASKLVGCAAFSRLVIKDKDIKATALAPVAVAHCYRHRRIGTALVREGIDRLEEAGEDLVFVLGDPPFYERFGFNARVASQYCAQWSGPAFMALELGRRGDARTKPQIVYPPAFEAFG